MDSYPLPEDLFDQVEDAYFLWFPPSQEKGPFEPEYSVCQLMMVWEKLHRLGLREWDGSGSRGSDMKNDLRSLLFELTSLITKDPVYFSQAGFPGESLRRAWSGLSDDEIELALAAITRLQNWDHVRFQVEYNAP